MNKWKYIGIGFISGVVVCFVVLTAIGLANQNKDYSSILGATYFDEPTEEIDAISFKVLQVIKDNAALVYGKDDPNDSFFLCPVYLMVNNVGHYYYDEEIIDVKLGHKVVQLGIYQYTATSGTTKTVPIIGIVDR